MRINNKITAFLTGPYIFFGFIFVPGIFLGLKNSDWIITAVSTVVVVYLFATSSGVEIDTETRRFRAYNKQFGVFKTGRWKVLDPYIGLTLVPMRKVYRMYSRSNRTNVSTKDEYRVYLVNKAKKPEIEIKRCKTEQEAHQRMDEFAIWLHLPVYSIKH